MSTMSKSASGDLDLKKRVDELEDKNAELQGEVSAMNTVETGFNPLAPMNDNIEISEVITARSGKILQIRAIFTVKASIPANRYLARMNIHPAAHLDFLGMESTGKTYRMYTTTQGWIESRDVLDPGSIIVSFICLLQ